jgi:AraC-like DNA-binding protein
MIKEGSLYETIDMMDQNMPIIFHKDFFSMQNGSSHFSCHWHEKIEFLYFTKGEAVIQCNSMEFEVKAGDLVVINSNELHQGYCISEKVEYYCIIIDTALFENRFLDICETKYIKPIYQNRILFMNRIENDIEAGKIINEFVKEYDSRKIGYELEIKAYIYHLLTFLLRNHVQLILTPREYEIRMNNLKRLNKVLEYIKVNYNEKIILDQLCSMVNLSRFHFCRIFKDMTGKSVGEYVNSLRINKAEAMLKEGGMNITEIAMNCGFNDINYFSRVFKKYKKLPPSWLLK